ncbi:class I SAM-dependent methyltransferase [Candidatus Woesearchaeota archaeon]|nr:class I SAM-dependent methyltransferase [Candidatus Woesearchaeota archaeon]
MQDARQDTYYDHLAPGYTALHQAEQERKLSIIAEQLAVRKTDRLLDVGCGPCFTTKFFQCRIVGIDPSIELLKQAPLTEKILGKAEALPFKDKSFDIVLSVTAIHNFDDVEKGLEEMRRVGRRDFAFGILKKSSKRREIEKYIRTIFHIEKIIEEQYDIILFCRKE